MGGIPSRVFVRLAQVSPLRLGLTFAGSVAAARAVQLIGIRRGVGGLAELGAILASVISIGLWIVVTWYRDEDALAAGVLLAASVGGGALLTSALFAAIARGSIGEGILTILFGQFSAVIGLVVFVPICAGIVWLARRISAAVTRPRRRVR
jgi:hypothetical protein